MARICPNPECPYQRRHKRPAEYRPGTETCSDCGAALVDEAAVLALSARFASAPVAASFPAELLRRIAFTAILFIGVALLSTVPMPALQPLLEEAKTYASSRDVARLLAFGLTPFVQAFVIVELVAVCLPALARLRVGSAADRARLGRAALVLGLGFVVIQSWGEWLWVRSLGMMVLESWTASPFVLFPVLIGGPVVLHLLTVANERWGIGNGYAVVLLALVVPSGLETVAVAFRYPLTPSAPALALAVAIVLVGATVLLLVEHERDRGPTSAPPRSLALPACGVYPISFGFEAFPAIAALGNLISGSGAVMIWVRTEAPFWVPIVVAVNLGILFTLLFNRPSYVGRVWASYAPPDASPDAVRIRTAARVRELLPRAGGLSLLAIVVLTAGPSLLRRTAEIYWLFGVTGMFAVATVMDLRAELLARLQGPLVPVWPVHRVYEVEPALRALEAEGIHAFARGFYARALFQFFGPLLPIVIHVPPEKAAAATEVFERARARSCSTRPADFGPRSRRPSDGSRPGGARTRG